MAGKRKAEDRVLTEAETEAFMKRCYVQALEQDYQEAQDQLQALVITVDNQSECIRYMERIAEERERKLVKLQKTLDQLEIEITRLMLELEAHRCV